MAEVALRKLEERLNCAICLDSYTDPKLLQCFHVFCSECLIKLGARAQQAQLKLMCPTCRKVTPIPENGVAGLQSAFYINELFDIRDDLIKARNTAATVEKVECSMSSPSSSLKKTTLSCSERELGKACEELTDSPDPSKCHVTGKGLEVAEVGEKSTALLQVVNHRGEPSEQPIETLECELVSEIQGTIVRGSVEREGPSQYELSYQPTIKGRHQLHIKVSDQPIRGSPFTVRVNGSTKKLYTPISTISGLNEPCGVAVNQSGEVVITEAVGHCISIFGPRGEKLQSFGTRGYAYGQFDSPRGVVVDGEGNILVVDAWNDRIQKFTLEGKLLTAVGSPGTGHLQFDYPNDITFNPVNNKIYVVEFSNHRVQVLNSDLTFSNIFGIYGSKMGQFNFPRGIACDSTGKVCVADNENHRIQVFTAKGKFLRMFGKEGKGRGELSFPAGITVDTSGIVYVSDSGNHRVSVFTSEGQYLTSIGRKRGGSEEFKDPRGLTVDSSGILYVCVVGNSVVKTCTHRMKKYSHTATTAAATAVDDAVRD